MSPSRDRASYDKPTYEELEKRLRRTRLESWITCGFFIIVVFIFYFVNITHSREMEEAVWHSMSMATAGEIQASLHYLPILRAGNTELAIAEMENSLDRNLERLTISPKTPVSTQEWYEDLMSAAKTYRLSFPTTNTQVNAKLNVYPTLLPDDSPTSNGFLLAIEEYKKLNTPK